MRVQTKRVDFSHQRLAIKRSDCWLICHGEKHTHRPIGRSKRLIFFDRCVAGEGLEGRADEAKRIESQLQFRSWRAGLNFLVQPVQALLNLLRLEQPEHLLKLLRLQVQKQRHGDGLQVVNALGRFDRRAGQDSGAPRLLAQALRESRCKFFELVDIIRLA